MGHSLRILGFIASAKCLYEVLKVTVGSAMMLIRRDLLDNLGFCGKVQ